VGTCSVRGLSIGILCLLANVLSIPESAGTEEIVICESRPGGAIGPLDYTKPADRAELWIVHDNHFTPQVENLIKGQSGYKLLEDIDYTLRVSPNHHRALYAMARYKLKYRDNPEVNLRDRKYRSAECYFQHAMQFNPKDGVVRMIYGVYLSRLGKYTQALQRYEEALQLMPDSAETHYNMGLLYFDIKQYDKSLAHASKAYELGYQLPGLRNRLERIGIWNQQAEGGKP